MSLSDITTHQRRQLVVLISVALVGTIGLFVVQRLYGFSLDILVLAVALLMMLLSLVAIAVILSWGREARRRSLERRDAESQSEEETER